MNGIHWDKSARLRVCSWLVSAGVAIAAACSPASGGAGASVRGEITVFAAASLTDVFNAMAGSFQQANPGVHVTLNFASSGTLVAQRSQGARADVFAAADQATMNNARTA